MVLLFRSFYSVSVCVCDLQCQQTDCLFMAAVIHKAVKMLWGNALLLRRPNYFGSSDHHKQETPWNTDGCSSRRWSTNMHHSSFSGPWTMWIFWVPNDCDNRFINRSDCLVCKLFQLFSLAEKVGQCCDRVLYSITVKSLQLENMFQIWPHFQVQLFKLG